MLAVPFLLLLGGCTTDTQNVVPADGTETPTSETALGTVTATPSPTTAPPQASVDPVDGSPACEDVPTFEAADAVLIACSGNFAVSPELFASNAGWHLFEAQDSAWVEIDYARTCCEPDDVTFAQLLDRNGLDNAMVARLCAASGMGSDSFSGCSNDGRDDEDVAFDATWLRVNGFGAHDFAEGQDVVLGSIERVFGPPDIFEAAECGAGPMTIASFDDFTLQFQDDEFIGWYYASSRPLLTTPSGVTIGITETDLAVVYDGVEINDDTLGREFFFEVPAGFMAGFISDTDSTVTALYAGTNCFFR